MSNDKVAATFHPRCPVTFEDWAECSLPAGHDGEHRGFVSHDLTNAYVVIPDDTQASDT